MIYIVAALITLLALSLPIIVLIAAAYSKPLFIILVSIMGVLILSYIFNYMYLDILDSLRGIF